MTTKPPQKITPEAWEKSFFSSGSYTGQSATGGTVYGSLNDYYQEQSCGAFRVEGKVFDFIQASKKRAITRSPGVANKGR